MAHRLTTCTFCGVGCGLYLETDGHQVTGIYPSMSHPANAGRICVRGWHVHEVASAPDRLRWPLLRQGGGFREVSWEEAFQFLSMRLRQIVNQHGPDALAFLNSPRCSNEETYLLQKLARAIVGTNNVDHGTGVYANNSIPVLLDMLGVPASTGSIADLDRSELIVVDGVDLALQLPTIGGRVLRAKLKGAKLIVVDARRHRLAENADFFLQNKPGTRVWLYGAMAKIIVDRGLMNRPFIQAHCRDYEAFVAAVREFDLLTAAEVCGLPAEAIEAAALAFAKARSAAILYSTGIEVRGPRSLQSLVNLALLTGNLGRPGAGLFALTEHNNLQGVCDLGMLPDCLPGYEPVTSAPARERLRTQWRAPALPSRAGLDSRAVLEHRGHGTVRGLWLCRYDPVTTATVTDAAARLQEFDLVVVQHVFMTGAARHAHVILPLVAFGEETVSFTSTERRIQLATQVADPPPGPMPAWQQFVRLARALGADWPYASTAEVMEEICQAVWFYSGASHENLAQDYGRQWPCTRTRPLGTARLFEEGLSGRPFKFVPVPRLPVDSRPPPEYPMALVFGQPLYYWHRNVLVQHSETLQREFRVLLLDYPEGFVEINDADARVLNIRDGDAIRLVAPHGASTTTARVTGEVRPGTVFVPYFVGQVARQVLGAAPVEVGTRGHPMNVRVERL